jgi:hypothetical protein
MARPADFLALAAKASAQTAKARAVAAEVQVAYAPVAAVRRKNEESLATLERFLSEARRKGHTDAVAKAANVVDSETVRRLAEQARSMDRMIEAHRRRTAALIGEARVAICRGARSRPGVRPRASRGRAMRLRGSRRGRTTATRAGPSSDPDLGDEPPGERPRGDGRHGEHHHNLGRSTVTAGGKAVV